MKRFPWCLLAALPLGAQAVAADAPEFEVTTRK
jgi:hypothetical protein